MRIVDHPLVVHGRALQGNPWGDPVDRTLHVLGPEKIAGPLPAVWFLTGYSGSPATALNDEPWSEGLLRRVQRLTDAGVLDPCLIAVPDCFTSLGGSQYLDSPALGAYETHLWQDLLPALENRFQVSHHGVCGKSSGGYGAIVQAMRHPEIIKAAVCHSGDMAFEYCFQPHFTALARALSKNGGVEGLLRAFAADPNKRGRLFDPICTLCMAACYSPDPEAPRGIALPIDPGTARIRPDVWARWLALDPVRMVAEKPYRSALAGLRLLWLDCGSDDEYSLQWGLRMLVERLRESGVRFEYEEFEGTHSGTGYRYDLSLPALVRALS